MKKRMIAPVLLLLLMSVFLTITATAAEIVDSGYCGAEGDGTNLTWVLTSDGVLTISGSGTMADWFSYPYKPPWAAFRFNSSASIKTVIIESGVTTIGENAFSCCFDLTSATLPNSLISIGDQAFDVCEELTNMEIPDSVTSIGEDAFCGCSSLTSVTIPNSVASIGRCAFRNCSSLKHVSIPDSVVFIGEGSFSACYSLMDVNVESRTSNYSSENGVLFNKDKSILICYPAGKSEANYVIPNSVSSIRSLAFDGCNKLENITIPNSFLSIGGSAFESCGLTSVIIPNSVTSIGSLALSYCSKLVSVTIPNSVTSIGYNAFSECRSLTDIYYTGTETQWNAITGCDEIPASATIHYNNCGINGNNLTWFLATDGTLTISGSGSMADYQFNKNNQTCSPWFTNREDIKTVVIQNNITSIGTYAFYGCSTMTNVTIPNSVTSIGICAFGGCSNLKSVTIPHSVTSIGDGLFLGCSGLKSVVIPNGVASIGLATFALCNELGSVTIPSSITSIEKQAFIGCNGLTDIYYKGDKSQWEQISIGTDNAPLQNATIHYNSSGSNVPASTPKRTTVPSNQYCIHVVDENGQPLKGASVYWEDSAETLTADTDDNGDAFFASFTLGAPKIDVSLTGYAPWTNRNSNWSKSDKRYSEVVLYNEAHGVYKLASAYYSNVGNETSWYNLLTTTKKLNLKNDGNLVGDLDFGNFYLTCTACTTQGIDRYELWQNSKQISQCADGKFPRLSVTSFSKGGGCFVRVIAKTGEEVDTAINLQFAENTINKENSISFKTDAVSFKISDDIPIVGGSSINLKIPDQYPLTVVASDSKLQIGFNMKIPKLSGESKTQQERYDDFKKTIESVKKATAFSSLTWGEQNHFLSYLQDQNKIQGLSDGWKKREVYFAGYFEGDWGSHTLTGKAIFIVKISILNMKKNGVAFFGVVPVPWTAHLKLGGEGTASGELIYEIDTSTVKGNVDLGVKPKLEVFGGVGFDEYMSGGAYGSAELDILYRLLALGSSSKGFQKIDMTGEFGIKGYFAKHSASIPFAHQTWHLYTGNNIGSASLASVASSWNSSLYNAEKYEIDDLSYLISESDWQGETASLKDVSARTKLLSLMSDTYRNAQPIMVATNDAIYASFIRANADSGERYAVVTKFDGTSWSNPVRVDNEAILDSSPALCANGNTVYLAYSRTTDDPGDSLLSYALKQEIVVGTINPDTLIFTEQAVFSGTNPSGCFVYMPRLRVLNGNTVLAWTDSTVSDDNSVLRPASSDICYASYTGGTWGSAKNIGTVKAPINSLSLGERNGNPAVACLLDEESGNNLYLLMDSGQETLAEDIVGRVRYETLPGTKDAAFVWNSENGLTNANGNSVEIPGISGEYAISGNNIYYSAATDGSANLTVLQYHAESGTWGLPIQLTDENRYLEHLTVTSLNGTDYVLGMHTTVTITENAVEDAKNLVWSAIMPVSDLRLDGIDYDAENVKAGENLPVTLTVINAGEHTVNRIVVTLNNSTVKTQDCSLKPGESLDIEVSVSSPSSLSEYLFAVEEPDKDDYSPDDNAATVQIGYADAAIELEYQQIGAKKALIATVTNRGVETASGSVAFYDANGSAIAESAFTDLAFGDTTIAVYELDENFAGINGGDVSAKVTLEQEELYTYNNADTLHIMEAESNPEKTEIASAVANGERGINAEISCESELTATAYCAFYNSDGKMLSVEIRSLSTGQNSLTFTASDQAASKAKIFVLDDRMIPQCASATVEVT